MDTTRNALFFIRKTLLIMMLAEIPNDMPAASRCCGISCAAVSRIKCLPETDGID
jgi:hypothetical protein